MENEKKKNIRVLFWGMMGEFSYLVLQGLLEAGIIPAAVMIPASVTALHREPILRIAADPPRSQIPISLPYLQRSITHLAWQKQISVYELRQISSPLVAEQLVALQADLVVVACFPWRIPMHLLSIPQSGFLNLHPSLLPDLRGPFPLFWAFRLGYQQTGVTIHQMDQELDTGAIVLQQELVLADGISGPEADQLLAVRGAALLAKSIQLLASDQLPRIPQPSAGSSYSRPQVKDFQIPTSWPARRAFNFIRGTSEWNYPFHITGPGVDLSVRQALSFAAGAGQEEPLLRNGRDCWIQFSSGVLHAR